MPFCFSCSSAVLTNLAVNMILGLFFGLADYLLLDNTDMSAMEAIEESLAAYERK